VRDDRRLVEPPELHQGGEASPTGGEGHVLSGSSLGGAEAEQVEHADREALSQA
jgi:hypothetical protein